MERITILSPHRDDAIFSLALSLSEWARRPELNLTVVNFFTVSQYAPRTALTSTSAILAARAREDRLTLCKTGRGIEEISLELLDAPLRVGLRWEDVCRPEIWHCLDQVLIGQLARKLEQRCRKGIVLAPLGLGDHLDHLAVRQAALRATRDKRLAFYEDLPYASWTSDPSIVQRVRKIETENGAALRPAVLRSRRSSLTKLHLAARYQSQITKEEAVKISRFSAKYRGGERIWIPKQSGRWLKVLRRRDRADCPD